MFSFSLTHAKVDMHLVGKKLSRSTLYSKTFRFTYIELNNILKLVRG